MHWVFLNEPTRRIWAPLLLLNARIELTGVALTFKNMVRSFLMKSACGV